MNSALVLIPYSGPISFWQFLSMFDSIICPLGFKIPKKSYCNRMAIASAQGILWLYIPLKGGRGSSTPYREIKISYTERWIHKHQTALQSAYSKSPFFEYYHTELFDIINHEYEYLYQLNFAILQWLSIKLKLNIDLSLQPCTPYSDDIHIPNPSIRLQTPYYNQVFEYKYPYINDLSVLDALFCLGPSIHLLWK